MVGRLYSFLYHVVAFPEGKCFQRRVYRPHHETSQLPAPSSGRTLIHPENALVRAVDAIWPAVDKDVDENVAHIIRIRKDMIIVNRPFKLTRKGTVDRRGILAEFKGEIDRIYARPAS
jgi:hypothetical protein